MQPSSVNSRSSIGSRGVPAAQAYHDPNPRKRLEAALQLLSVYEDQNPAVDDRDLERLKAATTSLSFPAATMGRGMPPGNEKGGGGKGDHKLKELQKRIFVSDTIMKKLHNKNKALQREVNALRDQIAAGGAIPVSASGESAAELEQYRKEMKKKDEQIRQLQLYTSELETRFRDVAHGKSVGAIGLGASSSRGSTTDGETVGKLRQMQAELEAAQKQVQSLEQHYQDLLSVKVDSVVNSNASTSQINKEVKLFFVALRKKLHEEYTAREAERAIANEQLYLLEKELMNKQVNNKLLESQMKQSPG